ncbi:hypothetical protein CYMTET_42122 [Cymbomonas tetramitiformis]|uniref:ABC transporter domain-containing protein n=1 Tax=Cymbomonas tetramitiformis TaxID=36881 RepID=A0AAE0F2W4_9CHLO|nr:hypothetical protein CYMTET_42122 [Cymbomonas tetramitiformis]
MLDTSEELSIVDASAVPTGDMDAKPNENVKQLSNINLPPDMASIFQEASEKWRRRSEDAKRDSPSKDGRRQSALAKASGVSPVVMQWRGLMYSVPIAKDKPPRVILNGITGAASPYHVLAVMGPTGSGKTSLLNTLAGRVPVGGMLNGEILVNGEPRTEQFKTQAAYVEQDELAFPFLSVRETFTLHARLRLPAGSPSEVKEQSVEAAITELGLTRVADSMVGGGMVRGLSGGERKRCSIGVELVTNPQALFLDEPTSGLDSFQAQNVVGVLSSLARNSRTVLTTIHQPRSSIFHLFDQLCLLVEGELIYLGSAKEAVEYFESLHFLCPNHTNPADFFMDVLSMDYRDTEWEKDSKERIQLFSSACAQSSLGERAHSEAGTHIIDASFANSVRAEAGAGLVEQYILLSGRAWRSVLRNKIGMVITLVIALVYSLLISALYRNIGTDQRGLQDRAGALFFISLNTAYGSAIPATQFFAPEKAVVNRERASRAYSVATYFWSKYWAEVPLKVAEQLVFGGILIPVLLLCLAAQDTCALTTPRRSGYLFSYCASPCSQAPSLPVRGPFNHTPTPEPASMPAVIWDAPEPASMPAVI